MVDGEGESRSGSGGEAYWISAKQGRDEDGEMDASCGLSDIRIGLWRINLPVGGTDGQTDGRNKA